MENKKKNPVIEENKGEGIGFFEKYLTLWVIICIGIGIIIGRFWPAFPLAMEKLEYAQISIPVAILIWFMIYPMMVEIDFSSILSAGKKPKGLTVTLVTNWVIKPFTKFSRESPAHEMGGDESVLNNLISRNANKSLIYIRNCGIIIIYVVNWYSLNLM
jgi:hypothetical protein